MWGLLSLQPLWFSSAGTPQAPISCLSKCGNLSFCTSFAILVGTSLSHFNNIFFRWGGNFITAITFLFKYGDFSRCSDQCLALQAPVMLQWVSYEALPLWNNFSLRFQGFLKMQSLLCSSAKVSDVAITLPYQCEVLPTRWSLMFCSNVRAFTPWNRWCVLEHWSVDCNHFSFHVQGSAIVSSLFQCRDLSCCGHSSIQVQGLTVQWLINLSARILTLPPLFYPSAPVFDAPITCYTLHSHSSAGLFHTSQSLFLSLCKGL